MGLEEISTITFFILAPKESEWASQPTHITHEKDTPSTSLDCVFVCANKEKSMCSLLGKYISPTDWATLFIKSGMANPILHYCLNIKSPTTYI
jgi:hypothetical protein